MIDLIQYDEYNVPYSVDTFLTIDDAKDALWQMECALDDSSSAAQSYRLQDAIAQLRELIDEQESDAG
jgi:hypothetical protein